MSRRSQLFKTLVLDHPYQLCSCLCVLGYDIDCGRDSLILRVWWSWLPFYSPARMELLLASRTFPKPEAPSEVSGNHELQLQNSDNGDWLSESVSHCRCHITLLSSFIISLAVDVAKCSRRPAFKTLGKLRERMNPGDRESSDLTVATFFAS